MKNKAFILAPLALYLVNLVCYAQTPTSTQNYVLQTLVKVPGKTNSAQLFGLSVADANRTMSYFDGLGRPLQNIQWQASPLLKDLVQFNEYDALGRETVKYLPYVSTNNNGSYNNNALTAQTQYYTSPPVGIVSINTPYAVTNFEASPLNRILEQGAPGAAWQPIANSSTGHTK